MARTRAGRAEKGLAAGNAPGGDPIAGTDGRPADDRPVDLLPAPAAPDRPAVAHGAVPRRALRPLAVCLEAAVLGVLAMVAANRVDGGPDPVLLGIGWASFGVSAVASLVFAARSGRLDGEPDPRPDGGSDPTADAALLPAIAPGTGAAVPARRGKPVG